MSHQTGRALPLDARAAGAFFGHLGVEWDLTTATATERARLAEWIAAHRSVRGLLHTGRTVYGDGGDPGLHVRGAPGSRCPAARWPTSGSGRR